MKDRKEELSHRHPWAGLAKRNRGKAGIVLHQ